MMVVMGNRLPVRVGLDFLVVIVLLQGYTGANLWKGAHIGSILLYWEDGNLSQIEIKCVMARLLSSEGLVEWF